MRRRYGGGRIDFSGGEEEIVATVVAVVGLVEGDE